VAPLDHADRLFTYAMGRLHEHSNVEAWLYTILRNIRLNQVRQQRASPKLVELDAYENAADLVIASARDPHALYVNKLEKQQVRVALHQPSEAFREIIVLREFAELSYQEIATLLDCPLGTVMSRLARARSKLGTLLSATQTPTARRLRIPEEIVGGSATRFARRFNGVRPSTTRKLSSGWN
jgi:RNA polymerase sigma-70 factor (ECF subfamily)